MLAAVFGLVHGVRRLALRPRPFDRLAGLHADDGGLEAAVVETREDLTPRLHGDSEGCASDARAADENFFCS